MCLCIGNENRLFCGREPVSLAEEFLHLSDLTCERSAHRSTAVRTLYSIIHIIPNTYNIIIQTSRLIYYTAYTRRTRPSRQPDCAFKREFIKS